MFALHGFIKEEHVLPLSGLSELSKGGDPFLFYFIYIAQLYKEDCIFLQMC